VRILIVGATGTLGRAVTRALIGRPAQHDVLAASRDSALTVDLGSPDTIATLYEQVGQLDAVICCAGAVPLGGLASFDRTDLQAAVAEKLLGQLELVRAGAPHLRDGGSFTLVSGITAYDPIRGGALLSTVNAGIDGFVRGAALDLDRGIRINSVSATVFAEVVDDYTEQFPGYPTVPVAAVAAAFVKSVEGGQTGQTYTVGY
jgi:NAD(P)-dependent dehydrogenase (short-subunit alcohol dehydrogenase family)